MENLAVFVVSQNDNANTLKKLYYSLHHNFFLSFCQNLEHYSPLHFGEYTEQLLGTTETKEQDQLGYYRDNQKQKA